MDALSTWLQELGLERYAPVFAENGVDLNSLRLLTDGDLEKIGVLLGHRRTLLKALTELRGRDAVTPTAPPIQESPAARESISAEAERRQLTVLFCDLVGSTALAQKLDPEELRDLMQAYQRACRDVIMRYEGHVAQYLGDGLMVYFGWPRAHEDDAVRAIRAGLEITQAVFELTASTPIRARVGIHTGVVVVGETGHGDASVPKAAVGDTPNIAARLQALAEPNCVVASERTRSLARGLFDYSDLGVHVLKGVSEPMHLFQVVRARATDSRFEAAHGGAALTSLVGREEEIALLLRRWRQAGDGEGQVVLVSGEPGIGKSRLTQALREQIAGEPYISLRYQCSPYHLNSALYPIIEQFEFAAGFTREDTSEQKLDKIEAVLVGSEEQRAESASLIAALLSLATERYPPLKLSPQKQKEKTLEAFAGQVEALACKAPVLMVFEDAHWIDPTSQELLDVFVPSLQSLPILLVITYRTEYTPHWAEQAHVTTLGLSRLGRRLGAELVSKVTGGKALPREVLEQIVAHTDGVPLFVEELTKSVLESKVLHEQDDRYTLEAPLPALAIPTTLRDSLIARLDRLAPVRELAQIGACIGREFSYELLAAVSPLKGARLEEALEQLTKTGLIFRRGAPPDATYTFKHALVQDAAYDSLLKSKRAHLHAQIAEALERDFCDRMANEPEVLALHFTQAGLNARAVPYWIKAGQRALARVALPEAVGHLTTALSVNERLAGGVERDRQELRIRVTLATAYLAFLGWAALEIAQTLRPARDLAMRLGADDELVAILGYLWVHHGTRCEYPRVLELIGELDALAQSREDSAAFLVARWTKVITYCQMGDFKRAHHSAEQLLLAYDQERHSQLAYVFNMDLKCDTLVWAGYGLWALGYPDQAKQTAAELIELARGLGHAFNLCWNLLGGNFAPLLRGETHLVRQWVAEAHSIAREHAMAFVADVFVPLWEGFALIEDGDHTEGYAKLTPAIKAWCDGGTLLLIPWSNAARAVALMGLKRFAEARALLNEAVQTIDRTGHRMHEAEVHRVLGELEHLQLTPDGQAAEKSFLKALEVARSQQAKGFELRAAISLARLWRERGKSGAARDLLAPVYNWFTEGFDTKDLIEAKTLLEELGRAVK
jgi:class 3 adenylate cyclase/predicted ATPase